MMSVSEYAIDINKTVEEILKKCRELSIYVSNEDDLLDDESIIMPKPQCLQEMLEVSRKLAKDVPFLRTDWYIVENQIYFGEMTFYPGCGFEPIEPYSKDVEWGAWISVGE